MTARQSKQYHAKTKHDHAKKKLNMTINKK